MERKEEKVCMCVVGGSRKGSRLGGMELVKVTAEAVRLLFTRRADPDRCSLGGSGRKPPSMHCASPSRARCVSGVSWENSVWGGGVGRISFFLPHYPPTGLPA